ncbi:MAG: GNAT family N-acetyltransferase [Rubrivivax sp.]|nr:GNAT family N-acetyltransferase [Rubrivivax sp.]
MTSSVLSMPVSGIYSRTPWLVEEVPDLDDFLQRCQPLEQRRPAPFQHSSWLRSWYECLGRQAGTQPLLLAIRAEGDPTDALLLPLVRQRQGLMSVVSCADAGITDYNAPLAREGLNLSAGDARALWTAIAQALRGNDLLRLDKLVAGPGAGTNAWLQMLSTQDSELFGNRFRVNEQYADWMTHLGKHARKEFERCWRVFQRVPDARFVRAQTVEQGLQLLRQLAQLQHARQAQTPGYFLDQPGYDGFYEHYLQAHLASGRCVLTALIAGDEMAAGLFGIFDGERYTMLRMAMGGESWKSCAPGKLLLERSIHAMHEQGCREFDFSIGDYTHKKAFRTTALPLKETCVALSMRGRVPQAAWRLKRALKARPQAMALLRKLRGPTRGG